MAIIYNDNQNPDRILYNWQVVNRVYYNDELVWPRKVTVNYSLMNYWYPAGGSSTAGKDYAYRSLVGVGYDIGTQYQWIQKDTAGPEPLEGTQEMIGNYLFFRGRCWTDSTMVEESGRVRAVVYLNGVLVGGNRGSALTTYTYSYKIPDNITTVNVTTSCGESELSEGSGYFYHTVFLYVTTS